MSLPEDANSDVAVDGSIAAPIVGAAAPDFSLAATLGPVARSHKSLASYRGHWLMLVFYPRDFSLVCPTELTALSSHAEEFRRRGCEILAVSTDSLDTHERWISTPMAEGGLAGLNFPLAADESATACRAYNVLVPWQHVALRGLFFIDPNGVLQYSVVHNTSVGRRTEELLRVLDALQTGGLCAENWTAGASAIKPQQAIGPGRVLAHYRIESVLGSGSFATVYKAYDIQLERTVALKVFKSNTAISPKAAMVEARTAAALLHPNICTIFSVDDTAGVPLIVMEYVAGESLDKRIARQRLSRDEALGIAIQIAEGMDAAHAAGVVHGDLKPENVLIKEDGLIKVTDFGLARRTLPQPRPDATLDWGAADSSGLSGTPAYMSPEQAAGERPTPASDVFAWGLILHEMLTGQRVVKGHNVLAALSQINQIEPHRLAAQAPPDLGDYIRKTLHRDPAHRWTMGQLAQGLSSLLDA